MASNDVQAKSQFSVKTLREMYFDHVIACFTLEMQYMFFPLSILPTRQP